MMPMILIRKDQRLVTETNELIWSYGPHLGINLMEGSDHLLNHSVRFASC
jgi:hypothetical protein